MKFQHLVDVEYQAYMADHQNLVVRSDTLAYARRWVLEQCQQVQSSDERQEVVIGHEALRLLIYRPNGVIDGFRPAVLYIHGGGYVMGTADMVDGYCCRLAQAAGIVVVSVDYRLAPEVPFPGPVEDAYQALRWVHANAGALSVDTRRISVMGHCAGGGLAAALAQLARDRGVVNLKSQVLIYPMLDYRTGRPESPVDNPTTGEFYWTREKNRFGWDALRGNYAMDDERIGYFSPALARSLEGLPPAVVAVGALDLFLEEAVAYSLRMSRAGVPVECLVYPSVHHGFEDLPDTAISRRHARDVLSALQRLA